MARSAKVSSWPDRVHLSDLQLPPQRFAGLNDLWDRPASISPQPVNVTLAIGTNLAATALTDGRDSLVGTVNYGTASKAILALVSPGAGSTRTQEWQGVEHLAKEIAQTLITKQGASSVHLKVSLPRALLSCGAFEFVSEWTSSPATSRAVDGRNDVVCTSQHYLVTSLALNVLIGLNPCERKELQPIVIHLRLEVDHDSPSNGNETLAFNPRPLVSDLSTYIVRNTDYGTVESLSTDIARFCFAHPFLAPPSALTSTASAVSPKVDRIAVRVDKPSAVALASAAGAEVVRERSFFQARPLSLPIRSFFNDGSSPLVDEGTSENALDPWSTAFISLGSNLGAQSGFIHSALRLLGSARRLAGASGREQWSFDAETSLESICKVVDTSFMYETAPMYVEDQPRFLNAAAEIRTTLAPLDLLDLTQTIEARLGRDHAASLALPKGPRVVDLDMVWHEGAYTASGHPASTQGSAETSASAVLHTPRLTLPHIGLAEREFVLRPLADIRPGWRHPVHGRTVVEMLDALEHDPGMKRVLPIRHRDPSSSSVQTSANDEERTLVLSERTYVMSIINTTPDSFSDGGLYADDAQRAAESALQMLRWGADMLDIGGMSTAPGRPDVEEDEEQRRVVPVIQGIRAAEGANSSSTKVPKAIISIDTFRPSTARGALDAGASLINDVTGARGTWSDEAPADSAGQDSGTNELGDAMLQLVAERGVPIVLMHMRGTSRTMTSERHTTYSSSGMARSRGGDDIDEDAAVVESVREELRICVERALRAGVPRWNIIIDPGIGFAKTREGSLALVRRVSDLTSKEWESADVRAHASDQGSNNDAGPNLSMRNLPVLLGPSRKRFLAPTTTSSYSSSSDRTEKTDSNPRDRVYATAAACAAGVSGGVDIVRVHDTREMVDVVRTADAIWRQPRRRR